MRQERENPVFKEGSKVNPLRRLGNVEFIGFPPFALPRDGDGSKEEGFEEIRLALHQEDHGDNEEKQPSIKDNGQKSHGFEPFLHPESQEGNLFENNYGGNYAQKMELNRRGVEIVLGIAHLDGKVFLTNFQQSRSRSEEQGDELAAKRFLIFGERAQKVEEENAYKRVVSIPEGWRVEVNDQRITEDLTEGQKLTGEKLQREFIKRFNAELREGLMECIWREKFSSEKDKYFRRKLFWSGYSMAFPSYLLIKDLATNQLVFIPLDLGIMLVQLTYINIMLISSERRRERMINTINPNFNLTKSHSARNIDHPLEYLMPLVEIDKVGRAYAYLAGKGRRLVREVKEGDKL